MNKLHKQTNEIILINNNVISVRKITKIGQRANVTGCLLIWEIREALFEGVTFQLGPKRQEGTTIQ